MKTYNLPEKIKTLIFDIDGTLYTSALYVFEQVDVQIRHFAHLKGISENEARAMIERYRKTYAVQNGGKKISLGNTFKAFGIPIETSVAWREELLEPSHFLRKDEQLRKSLIELSKRFSLIAVTNNPVNAARKTLEAIGAADLIPQIVGLDTCGKSKPNIEILDKACELTQSRYEECVSIGDRYDIDISLPLEKGMGGILVEGVEDVYTLNDIL